MTVSFGPILSAADRVALLAAGVLGTLGVIDASQGQQAVTSIGHIYGGLQEIATGVLGIWAIVSPFWAAFRSTKAAKIAAVQQSDTEHVTTSDPAVKAAVPAVTLVPPAQIPAAKP